MGIGGCLPGNLGDAGPQAGEHRLKEGAGGLKVFASDPNLIIQSLELLVGCLQHLIGGLKLSAGALQLVVATASTNS